MTLEIRKQKLEADGTSSSSDLFRFNRFPIFHLVTIQQWHLTSWSTSSVLAEGCSWKKCSNETSGAFATNTKMLKGSNLLELEHTLLEGRGKQKYDRLSKNKYYKYVQHLQLFARCYFNANEFNMQSTTTAVSPKSQVETMICSNVRNSNAPFLSSMKDIKIQP